MIPAFEREPYLRELEVEVTGVAEDDAGPYALLSDTVLYPEGGGQPTDHGYLGDIRVIAVRRVDGEIRHYLESAAATGPATLTLDWKRRFDHMQQHTAQHLITALAADEFGWETTSFHLGAGSSDIELDVGSIADTDLASLEERAATVIHEARAVTTRPGLIIDKVRSTAMLSNLMLLKGRILISPWDRVGALYTCRQVLATENPR